VVAVSSLDSSSWKPVAARSETSAEHCPHPHFACLCRAVHSRPGQCSMAKPPLDESLGRAEEGAH
jgi:hypothetical protein